MTGSSHLANDVDYVKQTKARIYFLVKPFCVSISVVYVMNEGNVL